jgi:hypothetical protein
VITASAARRALTRKARRAEFRRQMRAAIAAVAREEQAAAEPGEMVEVRYVPRSLARTLPQARPLPTPGTPQQRVERLCGDRPCPCGTCEACRRIRVEQKCEIAPRQVRHTRETWAEHEWMRMRELALWHALVWAPEVAAEAAQFRPDDRPQDSAWARLRPVLEARGLLRAEQVHGPPALGDVVLCHSADRAPPVAVAARWPEPRACAIASEAPVICT